MRDGLLFIIFYIIFIVLFRLLKLKVTGLFVYPCTTYSVVYCRLYCGNHLKEAY